MNTAALKTLALGLVSAILMGAVTGAADFLTHAQLLAFGGIGATLAGLLTAWAYRVIPAHLKTEDKNNG